MLNDKHSVQRKKLRRLHALQMKALRLVQKDERLGGELGGLEADEAAELSELMGRIDSLVKSGKTWLKVLHVTPKERA